jgi:hypothetical protein
MNTVWRGASWFLTGIGPRTESVGDVMVSCLPACVAPHRASAAPHPACGAIASLRLHLTRLHRFLAATPTAVLASKN